MDTVVSLAVLAPRPSVAVSPVRQDSVATITTDTGALAPGRKTFTRYGVPGMCVAAALDASDVLRRSLAAQAILDTIRITAPTRDTLPGGAVTVARACGAHFTVAGTAAHDLPDLFTLALLEQNDTLAHAVVQRWLARTPNAAARDTVFEAAIGGYLAAEPARVAAAEAMIAQMDALGPRAQIARLAAHDSLLAFASSTYDTARMRQEAERIIALGHEVPTEAIKYDYDPIVSAYRALVAITFVTYPDSLSALGVRAKQDLSRFPPGAQFPPGKAHQYLMDFKQASPATILRALLPTGMPDLQNMPLAPLQATYWFPKKPDTWPVSGARATLVVNGDYTLLQGGSRTVIDVVQRALQLALPYGPHALAISIAITTKGAALRSLPLPSAAEADTINWYFHNYLKLPVTVAVIEEPMRQFPLPDGRRFVCDEEQNDYQVCKDTSANAHLYLNREWPVLLIGQEGQLLYAGEYTPILEALIVRTLSAPMAATSHAALPRSAAPAPAQQP